MSNEVKTLTCEQQAAIEQKGRLIVSASAGSGKTFVMIRRLADYIQAGGDLDGVLAVTFTKKAAAQMKEKLRSALIDRVRAADPQQQAHLKNQLSKIPGANISTIDSFCAYLLRTHFYLADIDGEFEILSEDNGEEKELRRRAMDGLFDRLYGQNDPDFLLALDCYTHKRSDSALRQKIAAAYDTVRKYTGYRDKLKATADLYTEKTFNEVSGELAAIHAAECRAVRRQLDEFMKSFDIGTKPEVFIQIADEMYACLYAAEGRTDIFEPLKKFSTTKRPVVKDEYDKIKSEAFNDIKKAAKKVYEKYSFPDREREKALFLESGRLAAAFARLVLQFDDGYTAIKKEEGKIDYGDLEHLTLKILEDDEVKREVRGAFRQVFVDEYQDVNPVQEALINAVSGANLFLVGDVKQAIYGFRGSKSVYFTDKIREFSDPQSGATALALSSNFRSSPAVIDGVNRLFSALMTRESCGIDYAKDGLMVSGGAYPEGSGGITLHIFGKDEKPEEQDLDVYSVAGAAAAKTPPSREGLAIADIIYRELETKIYDLDIKGYRDVTPSDICVLVRKNTENTVRLVRTLADCGLPISGSRGGNVCKTPECRQIIDILSYIDNGEQDIPMASAMLSPIGGFSEDELAAIRIACPDRDATFRSACENYGKNFTGGTAQKLIRFCKKIDGYRELSALFGAATLIDTILGDNAMEPIYGRGNGAKLKNIRRLAAEAQTSYGELGVSAFLEKLKTGGYFVPLTQSGGGDSIKVMTMHSSKGLEFPVVIIADVCRQFKGAVNTDIPSDDKYGFVHKTYDTKKRVYYNNVLCTLQGAKEKADNVKNEMNLLYVACTRAKYRLHILSSKELEFSACAASSADCHGQMLDMSLLEKEYCEPQPIQREQDGVTLIGKADAKTLENLRSHYKIPYAYASSVDLPVKSSASAILRMQEQDDDYYARHELFPEAQGETGADYGIAYHRFLQLCDFSVKDRDGISRELEKFLKDGGISDGQYALLNVNNLVKILNMDAFSGLDGRELYREQEFLCALPANAFLPTDAADSVMVQGAIDLFCTDGSSCAIIDYKYSAKDDGALIKTYAPQLMLYRLAAEKITGIPKEKISATIINIYRLREIPLITA